MRWAALLALVAFPPGHTGDYQSSGVPIEGGTFSGAVVLDGGATFRDDDQAVFGTGSDFACEYDTAVTPDSMVCGVGTDSRVWFIAEKADIGTDWALAQQSSPNLCIQSADATSVTERICSLHDGTDAQVRVDSGDLKLDAAGLDVGVDVSDHFVMDFSNDKNDWIGCTANDQCRLTVGGAAILQLFSASVSTNTNATFFNGGIIAQVTVPTITLAAAATTFAATRNHNIIDCDAGGNTIATITGDQPGMEFCMEFVDASCTITDTADGAADTINLSAAFTSSDDDILCMIHNGTNWREVSRSVN